MKTIGLLTIFSLMILVSGCYTQLALNDNQTDDSLAVESAVVQGPPAVGVVLEPMFVPVVHPHHLPVALQAPASGPAPQAQPVQQKREIGNQRSDTGDSQGSRSTGSHRGGR